MSSLGRRAPLVTVGLPVFNGENFIGEALSSLQSQTLTDIEIIVADNASTDATRDIVRRYASEDERVRLVVADWNRGATWNYNRLMDMASGRYFKWAAHDDVCREELLHRCVEALQSAGDDAVLCYPRSVIIDDKSRVVDDDFVDGLAITDLNPRRRLSRYARHVGEQHAVFGVMRTAAARRTGLIRACWGGDIPFLAEMLMQGCFVEVPDRLFLRRYHPASSMVANASNEAIVAWFDPGRAGRRAMPRTHLLGELVTASLRGPLPSAQRIPCACAVTGNWIRSFGRVMAGEMRAYAVAALRHRSGAAVTTP